MKTQKQIPAMNNVKVMEQIVTGGVDVLREKVSEGIDLKTLRKKNGMSVLHVAACTCTENALEIVKEIIQNRYIDVNDVNGVGSGRSFFSSRLVPRLSITLSTITTVQSFRICWNTELIS